MTSYLASAEPSLGAAAVLHAFRHDAPYFFLGAAFVTVGFVAILFSVLRRRRDSLLIYFGIFAALYGLRLWVQASLLALLIPDSVFYTRLRFAISYLIPIPFVLYLRCACLLLTRLGRFTAYVLAAADTVLAVVTLASGPTRLYDLVNTVLVIVALAILIAQFTRDARPGDKDFRIIRRGLVIFAVFALWDNLTDFYFQLWKVEPVGFAIFLGCLGYVAARRTLSRDLQLTEIQKELEVATRIQLSILPAEFPGSQHFKVVARYQPMTSVAGDFYDYVVADHGRAGLLIADVSGHGVPAALIASMVKLAAASQRTSAADPSQFLLGMNAALCRNTEEQFVTAAYVHIDSASRELRYSAAAHPPVLLLRGDAVFELEENGLMLGAFPSATYSTATRPLEPGDRLLLYTDGIVEASNAAGEFFGSEGLGRVLRESAGSPPGEAADRILSAVRRWSSIQEDDLTLIVCDFAPSA